MEVFAHIPKNPGGQIFQDFYAPTTIHKGGGVAHVMCLLAGTSGGGGACSTFGSQNNPAFYRAGKSSEFVVKLTKFGPVAFFCSKERLTEAAQPLFLSQEECKQLRPPPPGLAAPVSSPAEEGICPGFSSY